MNKPKENSTLCYQKDGSGFNFINVYHLSDPSRFSALVKLVNDSLSAGWVLTEAIEYNDE